MKESLFTVTLMAVLIPFVLAQDSDRLPQASLDREVGVERAVAANLATPPRSTAGPPSYCKPCLFYAGDFDPYASDANGLANEFDIIVSTGAATYVPFIVPKGKTWTVTGLFTNNFMASNTLDPKVTPYEVRKDIPHFGGSGGHLVCHGKKLGKLAYPFLCDDFGYLCYAVIVDTIKGCRLPSGKYWMSVIPYCTNKNDGQCQNGYRAFVTNDDGAMAHRYGPLEPANNSFFNSVYYGAVWEPSSEQQSSSRFSVGVEGTEK